MDEMDEEGVHWRREVRSDDGNRETIDKREEDEEKGRIEKIEDAREKWKKYNPLLYF